MVIGGETTTGATRRSPRVGKRAEEEEGDEHPRGTVSAVLGTSLIIQWRFDSHNG